jgi:hypothetical protein
MAVTQDILGHYRLSKDSPQELYDSVAGLPAGSVFKVAPDDYEQVMLNMQEYHPNFKAVYIHPGTDLYTIEGSDSLVVVHPDQHPDH